MGSKPYDRSVAKRELKRLRTGQGDAAAVEDRAAQIEKRSKKRAYKRGR